MQFSSWMGQVSKSSYFASANDVLMTKITKLKPQVVFKYGFPSFLQHRNTANRLGWSAKILFATSRAVDIIRTVYYIQGPAKKWNKILVNSFAEKKVFIICVLFQRPHMRN